MLPACPCFMAFILHITKQQLSSLQAVLRSGIGDFRYGFPRLSNTGGLTKIA